MAYNRTYWVDHVTDQGGTVIQQGTPMDQAHFNKLEIGLSDNGLAQAIMQFKDLQTSNETVAEVRSITLTGNGSKWPFNNAALTVALQQLREKTTYDVDIEVVSYSGGRLGDIKVQDRALNGFKLLHEGSATTVNLIVRITGGMVN